MTQDEQIETDLAELGDIHLRNWGNMLASVKWPGPAMNLPPQPMFRDVQSGYRQNNENALSWDEDEAQITHDILTVALLSPKHIAALHCYYVRYDTRYTLQASTDKLNAWCEKEGYGQVSRSGLVQLLRDVRIQIGAIHQFRQHSALDIDIISAIANQK